MSAVRAHALAKSYGDTQALRGVDLDIAAGEVVALLGPNGAGKTTTVEILEGYRRQDSGTVEVLGEDPATAGPALKQRIGIVLQQTGVEDELTVRESIEVLRRAYDRPRDIEDLISTVGLDEKAHQRIKSLSGGQKRRLDLALAIAGNPELLFLDEPTTGFDPAARREAWGLIREMVKTGTTVLLTTHYLEEAQELADRVVVIAAGKVVAEGPPDALGNRLAGTATISFRVSSAAAAQLEVAPDPDGVVRLEVGDPTGALHRITGAALEAGIPLEGLQVTRPSLEDAYLELIGHETSD